MTIKSSTNSFVASKRSQPPPLAALHSEVPVQHPLFSSCLYSTRTRNQATLRPASLLSIFSSSSSTSILPHLCPLDPHAVSEKHGRATPLFQTLISLSFLPLTRISIPLSVHYSSHLLLLRQSRLEHQFLHTHLLNLYIGLGSIRRTFKSYPTYAETTSGYSATPTTPSGSSPKRMKVK